MAAAWSGAPRPGGEQVDAQPLPPTMTARPEPSVDAITRHREGYEDQLTSVLRNAVPARADPLDGELGETLAVRL